MNFSTALDFLKGGCRVYRKGWATSNATIALMEIPGFQPFVAWCIPGQEPQPGWLCSQRDMLAEDWVVENTLRDGDGSETQTT